MREGAYVCVLLAHFFGVACGCCSKLSSGDTLLVLAQRDFASKIERSHEFLMVTTLDPVTKKPTLYDYVPLALFAGMIAWVVGTNNQVIDADKQHGYT